MPRCIFTGKNIESTIILDTHELAWAAGFFDGEGCITYNLYKDKKSGKSYPRLIVRITQTSFFPLERFRKATLNQGNVNGPLNSSSRGIRQSYYVFNSPNYRTSYPIMILLWKYLSRPKRNQFKDTLKKFLEYKE